MQPQPIHEPWHAIEGLKEGAAQSWPILLIVVVVVFHFLGVPHGKVGHILGSRLACMQGNPLKDTSSQSDASEWQGMQFLQSQVRTAPGDCCDGDRLGPRDDGFGFFGPGE